MACKDLSEIDSAVLRYLIWNFCRNAEIRRVLAPEMTDAGFTIEPIFDGITTALSDWKTRCPVSHQQISYEPEIRVTDFANRAKKKAAARVSVATIFVRLPRLRWTGSLSSVSATLIHPPS
jgi:hypothetical protein